ncbi:MAG: VWA domain-containing protein, partial [Persicimonas sp.]
MHFGQPQNLYLLLLLVPAVAALVGYLWWKRRTARRVGDHPLIRAMGARHSNRRQILRAVLVLVALALVCVAAAQPQWGEEERQIERFGVDVAFALDLSNSMLAEDTPPNRLDAAKDEIKASLEALSGDRAGLVVFTAISFAQSPLTGDSGAIRFYLDRLEPGQMPVGGTSIGEAIRDSVELLTGQALERDGSVDSEAKQPEAIDPADNQVIVLITDGEDHESDPLQAAEIARERGIHIVTVGIGSPDGSRVPEYGEDGELRGFKRDEKGELVYSRLDEKTLRKMARETDGRYLRYDGPNSVAGGLQDFIDELEESEFESMMRRRYKDRYMYFLAPAILLLILSAAIRERRDEEPDEVERLDGGRSILLVLLVALVSVGAIGCEDVFRTTVSEVDRGNELIDEGEYEAALEQYERADEEVASTPELRYNQGIAHLGAEEYDEARETFARALETDDPELYFDVMFNLGLALASQEEWKHAHRAYKEALGVDLDTDRPENRERLEQARHNLQVTFRRLYPPCEELEDDLEENDRPDEATQLEEPEQDDLTLCGDDPDWFAIPAVEGTKLEVDATFEQLREEPDPEHEFLPEHEDLQIALYDSRGEETIAVDEGSKADTEGDEERVERRLEQVEVTDEMLRGDDEFILMKAAADKEREFSYEFDIEVIPPCEQLDDDFEDNDSAQEAAPIEGGSHELHICPDDEDWFTIDLEADEALFVDLQASED